MRDGEGKIPGYSSQLIGRQGLHGSAVDRILNARDTNVASKVNNKKWYNAIVKNHSRMDVLHERLLKD